MQSHLKLKVCGMRNAENISQLALLEPDYIGFIFYPKSKRFAEELDRNALAKLPATTKKTGVFVNAEFELIIEKAKTFGLTAIQLHGEESPEFCKKVRDARLEVIKAFGIDSNFDFSTLNRYEASTDFFLFDTKTEAHGGSGRLFDWEILEGYTGAKPYFLSGGLSEDAIPGIKGLQDPRLYALDLNSRFETELGLKDIKRLRSFFNEIRVPA